jgi:hypothetical protein
MQYGLDNALMMSQQGPQLLQQQGIIGLQQQQQQPSHQPPAPSLQLRAPAAAAAAAAGGGAGPAGFTAEAEGPHSGNQLLLQLLREEQQQFRDWQQQQQQQPRTVRPPGHPPDHADVYTMGLDPTSSPGMAASGDATLRSLRSQQQQQQQQQLSELRRAQFRQYNGSQQSLMLKQESLSDAQSLSAAATRSASSGSLPQTGSGLADTGFMGLAPPAAAAAAAARALPGASNIRNQVQYMASSSVDGQQGTSRPLLHSASGSGGFAGGLYMPPQQQEQEQQQQVLLDPFLDPVSNQPSWAGRGSFAATADYEGLEDLLLAAAAGTAAGAPPAAAAAAAAAAGAAWASPAEQRSLSAADAQNLSVSTMLDPRWQQRSLRAIDSAPARLTLSGEKAAGTAGAIPACVEMECSGLLGLAGDPRGLLYQYQAGLQGPSAAAAAAHALGGSMGLSADAHGGMHTGVGGAGQGAGAGAAMETGQRSDESWQYQAGGTLSGGAQGAGRVLQFGQQQQIQGRGTQGAPAGQVAADLMMQQLQQSQHQLAAELQALLDSTR